MDEWRQKEWLDDPIAKAETDPDFQITQIFTEPPRLG
jgi:hypothetical protein